MAITLIGEIVNSCDAVTGFNVGNISGDDDFVEGTGAIGLKVAAGQSRMYTTSLGATAPYDFSVGGGEEDYLFVCWINTKLAAFVPILDAKQATYFANHGRYWQGIRTPPQIPEDGLTVNVDMNVRPTDQAESWNDLGFSLPAKLEMSIEIYVHNGPLGHGYTGIVTASLLGRTWQRARGFGAHSFTFNWTEQADTIL